MAISINPSNTQRSELSFLTPRGQEATLAEVSVPLYVMQTSVGRWRNLSILKWGNDGHKSHSTHALEPVSKSSYGRINKGARNRLCWGARGRKRKADTAADLCLPLTPVLNLNHPDEPRTLFQTLKINKYTCHTFLLFQLYRVII